jgi:enoyl-CoA hydratase/carnithine racemase
MQFVEVEHADHIATVTMNRPEVLNALNRDITRELHATFDELGADFPNTRVIILTGGGRGFCSGADVGSQANSLNGNTEPKAWDPADSIVLLAPKMQNLPQPVIAAVNGVATGAGLSLALAADFRIAAEGARFAAIFIKRGLVPDTGMSQTLPEIVGHGTANEMTLTGRLYDAQWALQKGLVNYVVPPDELMAKAREFADEMAHNPPLALRSIKGLMHVHSHLEQQLPLEHDANNPSMNTRDRREAVMSFLEKRTPMYEGR